MTTCWKICINLKEKHAIKWLIDFKYDSTRITQVLKTMRQIILFHLEALCVIQYNLMLIFCLLICWLILKREPIPHKKTDFTDQFSYPLVPRIRVLKKHHFKLLQISGHWCSLQKAPQVPACSTEAPQSLLLREVTPSLVWAVLGLVESVHHPVISEEWNWCHG